MKDIVLLISFLCMLVFGYFIMSRLSKFLDGNRKAIEKESEKEDASCVILTENLSEEDAVEEFRRFYKKHKDVCIVLCGSENAKISKSIKYCKKQK